MIRRIKNAEIDLEKYGGCVENSQQRMYCATPQFLNIACGDSWEILVQGDYEAVMPVPLINKLGLRMVLNPVLCQQLGVFSEKDDTQINEMFHDFLQDNYRVAYYAFNYKNQFLTDLPKRTNYLLESNDYALVRQRYSPKRRRKLVTKEDHASRISVAEVSWEECESFMYSNVPGLHNEALKTAFFSILKELYSRGLLEMEGFFFDGNLINLVSIYKDHKSAVLFGTFNNREMMKLNGASILIDRAIERHIAVRNFDFEGSEVPAVAEFFRGFRPSAAIYPVIRNSKTDLLKNFLKI